MELRLYTTNYFKQTCKEIRWWVNTQKMEKYNWKYNILPNGDLNENYPIKIIYKNGDDLKYSDPALIFQSLSVSELIPFMSSAINGDTYMQEHKSFVFGPRESDYDNSELKEGEVLLYYVDTNYVITQKEFFGLCTIVCQAIISLSRDILFKKKVVDSHLVNSLLALIPNLERRIL